MLSGKGDSVQESGHRPRALGKSVLCSLSPSLIQVWAPDFPLGPWASPGHALLPQGLGQSFRSNHSVSLNCLRESMSPVPCTVVWPPVFLLPAGLRSLSGTIAGHLVQCSIQHQPEPSPVVLGEILPPLPLGMIDNIWRHLWWSQLEGQVLLTSSG